ncbi:Capsular polysaccharide synthesis protein [Pantoea ananatis]|uniref:glycosyltransferase family 32 protein n=1 Tax=Pantoea ananas TaxID=553 RepID=UPI00099D27C2|nr:capsular polysaccharide synthesis protein [Pantoea ananatis]SKA70607.1 Capsular polysaccharide synthesis protein [Pantoea ananatis]
MNSHRRSLHHLWRQWEKLAFTSRMLWTIKQHRAVSAPEYDPTLEQDVLLESVPKTLPAIAKKVWLYWPGDRLPASVALNASKICRDNPDHEIHLLTPQTLGQWLPDVQFVSSDLTPQLKSDIIRLELLLRYGGISIDCNTLLFEDLAWVHQAQSDRPMDVLGYYRQQNTINPLRPMIETGFIAAPAQNPFIREWLKQLAPVKYVGRQNYLLELMKRSDFPAVQQNLSNPGDELTALAHQLAMDEHRRVNTRLRKAEASVGYYQQVHAGSNDACVRSVLFQQRPLTPPPVIRLSDSARAQLDFNLRLRFYNRASLVGEAMHDSPSSPARLSAPQEQRA